MHRTALSSAIATCLLALVACGPNIAPLQCAAGEVLCSGVCMNLQTSKSNCGACGIACPTPANGGATACVSGVCQPTCAAPLGLCNARTNAGASGFACTDTSFDPVNCGACGQVCPPQQTCTAGQCTSCPSGQLQCPTSTPGHTACKAVLSDNLNCGGCGAVCATPSTCQNGACVAPGLSNCGNASGGPAQQKDLQNDPLNCGACGNACLASEICRAGSCNGCPGATCANLCVDLASDARNCGACATTCTGTQACLGGKCAQPVKLTLLNPTQALVPSGPLPLRVRVDSALPLQSVQYVSVVGGVDSPPTALSFDASLNPVGVPSSAWTASVASTITNNGTLAIIARDIAWKAGAADAALHQDRAQIGPLQLLAPPATTPTITASQSGAPLAQGSWVPLNAPPITFTAKNLGPNAASVQFINRPVSDTYVVGTGTVASGAASITVVPAELTSQSGGAQIVACPVDVAGQVTPISSCVNSSGTDTVDLTVGRVPLQPGAAFPVLSAQADGSSPVAWFMGPVTSGSAQLIGASITATAPVVPGPPVVGTSYVANFLKPASDTSTGVLAIRTDGTALDRFDCLNGGNCNRTPYVTTSGSFKLVSMPVATAKTILFTDGPTSQYLYANNPAPSGGGAPAVTQPVVGTPAYPYSGAAFGPASAYAQPSGAVVFYTQASSGAGPYQLRIAHPNLSGGTQALGAAHTGAPVFLQVFPTGEIVWQYLDAAGGSVLEAAYYDGTSAAAKVANVSAQLATGASDSWQVVRPQVLLGVAADKGSGSRELIEIDLNRSGTIQIAAPSPVSSTVGAIISGVRTRPQTPGRYAVSDDQRKAIYVTADPGPLLTLWLLDLVSGAAGQLYSTPTLESADAAPRFVHSAAGSVGALPGNTPSAGLAQVPAVIWGEDLAPAVGNNLNQQFQPMRLFYALYKADGSVPPPVAVDRIAYSVTGPGALPLAYTVESSAGANLFFLSGTTNEADLYSVPLTGTGTSSLVIDRPSGYLLREDKGRFLVQRSDGVTFAGKLQAGTMPASTLVPIAFDGYGGVIPINKLLSSLTSFGFSADGDHAWALSQISLNVLIGGGQPVLRFIDLGTLAHQNLGAEAFEYSTPPLGTSRAPLPCFLGNASFAIGYANLVGDTGAGGGSATAAIYAAPTATGLHQDLGLSSIVYSGASVPTCQPALDGSEALVLQSPVVAAVALSGGSVSATNLPTASVGGPSQLATYSPFGGPYLNEYDLVQVARSGSTENLFKVWGESAAGGGKPFPFLPVAVGGTLVTSTARPTTLNAALLLMLQLSGPSGGFNAIPIEVPLAGKAAPVAPLP